jgi:hypothetical protein
MNDFFDPSVEAIIATARKMLAAAPGTDTVLLVGGMSASQYVQSRLKGALSAPGISVVTPTFGYAAVVEGEGRGKLRCLGCALYLRPSCSQATARQPPCMNLVYMSFPI